MRLDRRRLLAMLPALLLAGRAGAQAGEGAFEVVVGVSHGRGR